MDTMGYMDYMDCPPILCFPAHSTRACPRIMPDFGHTCAELFCPCFQRLVKTLLNKISRGCGIFLDIPDPAWTGTRRRRSNISETLETAWGCCYFVFSFSIFHFQLYVRLRFSLTGGVFDACVKPIFWTHTLPAVYGSYGSYGSYRAYGFVNHFGHPCTSFWTHTSHLLETPPSETD